jgi:hypothetical protein
MVVWNINKIPMLEETKILKWANETKKENMKWLNELSIEFNLKIEDNKFEFENKKRKKSKYEMGFFLLFYLFFFRCWLVVP